MCRHIEDGAALLHLPSDTFFRVNHIGARIWELLEHAPTLADLTRALTLGTDVPPTAADEIARFLTTLRARGLVEMVPSQPVA